MSDKQSFAGASGEQTHTNVGPGFAFSSATSTGQGPQQHEASAMRSTQDFEHMGTHDLKVWLLSRGADLRGAIERSDLIDIAKKMPPEGGSGGGGSA